MIRILLVDDHDLVRDSWQILLERNPRFKVITSCKLDPTCIELATVHKPDIILLDLNFQSTRGIELAEKLIGQSTGAKLIGLSIHNNPGFADRLLTMGARGFLTKTSSLAEINEAIISVYEGNLFVCDEIRKMDTGIGKSDIPGARHRSK